MIGIEDSVSIKVVSTVALNKNIITQIKRTSFLLGLDIQKTQKSSSLGNIDS